MKEARELRDIADVIRKRAKESEAKGEGQLKARRLRKIADEIESVADILERG